MKLQIGDIVKDTVWQGEGQIFEEYANYWATKKDPEQFISMTPNSWLDQQIVPFSEEEINNQRWFTVHCFDGGAILTCESRLEFISRINLNNLL